MAAAYASSDTVAAETNLTPSSFKPSIPRLVEDARVDLPDVAQVGLGREHARHLLGREKFGDVRVGEDVRAELAALVPGLHRVALHPLVSLLAGDARAREREQQLAAVDEP